MSPTEYKMFSGVKKIAILRAIAVGDFIVSLPALESLRLAYPEAEIVLLARPWLIPFCAARTMPFDRIEAVPFSRGVNDAGPEDTGILNEFVERMRKEKFDLGVQMHGGGRNSNPLLLRMNPRITVGMRTADAPGLDRWIPYVLWQPEVLRCLEVAALAGAGSGASEPCLRPEASDLAEAERYLKPGSSAVVLNPGAGDKLRRWPPERFALVGDALAEQGAVIYINGSPDECDVCDTVASLMRYTSIDLSGCLSLNGLTGLLSRADLLVSNDTGTLHLARALGCPTVGIYWCANAIHFGLFSAARHAIYLSWQMHCPRCGRHCMNDAPCGHDASFVSDVGADEVLEGALSLYKRYKSPLKTIKATMSLSSVTP
jgi:ADP-heptose:LPS heptosyltransferase